MELYNDEVDPYLVANDDHNVNMGFGFFIKKGTSPKRIEIIRKYHDERLQRGKPYYILDFLAEDLERDPDSIEFGKDLCYYRKRKKSPDESHESKLPRLQFIKLRNLKRATRDDPLVSKLIRASVPFAVGYLCVFEIPDGVFTPEEIEILRKKDAEGWELYDEPFVANFLPDDVRPSWVKKM